MRQRTGRFSICIRFLPAPGNKPYEGYFFVNSQSAVRVAVQLRDFTTNAVLASTVINYPGGNWTMLNFTLTPNLSACRERALRARADLILTTAPRYQLR